MKTLFFLCLFSFAFSSENFKQQVLKAAKDSKYLFVIDGGGSKTTLHVLDSNGQEITLKKADSKVEQIVAAATNPNTVGTVASLHQFHELFQHLKIAEKPFAKIANKSTLIAGVAGFSSPTNRVAAQNYFEHLGFTRENIVVCSDADLALHIAGDRGVILISGTGSVAFGMENGKKKRVGGLGRVIGDEGSGYFIGKLAIKKALEDELGYGKPTILTQKIKEMFDVDCVYDLLAPIHNSEISPTQISSISPIVFASSNDDKVASEIIQVAKDHLNFLLRDILKLMSPKPIDVYLIGGVFRSNIPLIKANPNRFRLHNVSDRSIAVFAVQKILENKD